MVKKTGVWLLCLGIIAACTCGARTECNTETYRIAFLTNVHSDPGCRQLSTKGVMLYEASTYIVNTHNEKTKGNKIEVIPQDTCGSVVGTVKAAMKAMIAANVNCLHPPNFLGMIGPDTVNNAEAVHKMTSLLKVPLVVKKAHNVPFMYHLNKESDAYLVKGTVKLLEALKWRFFTLVIDVDADEDDDVQNLARKLTAEATHRKICVMLYSDDNNEYSSQIVHIGKPRDSFISELNNSTVLIISEGNLKNYLSKVESSGNVILLEDSRKDLDKLEERVMKSKLWAANSASPHYDEEELRDVRWLEDAIESYASALDTMCKNKKCKNQLNAADWNTELSKTLEHRNAEERSASRNLELLVKSKSGNFQELATMSVKSGVAKLTWKGKSAMKTEDDEEDDEDEEEVVPEKFKKLISKDKTGGKRCTKTMPEVKVKHEYDDDDDDDDEIEGPSMNEMSESDWWTMVLSVSAVGVGMFFIGITAVHIVLSNMRAPKEKRTQSRFSRDGSFRRSDRYTSNNKNSEPAPPQRSSRSAAPRRDDSFRDSISERSV